MFEKKKLNVGFLTKPLWQEEEKEEGEGEEEDL